MKTAVRQRADYTFKYNRLAGRHGWLRLTPAYSVKLVEEILDRAGPVACVLDPFSGTGTTALCAANRGYHAVGYELNPFLVWFGRVKTATYRDAEIEELRAAAAVLGDEAGRGVRPSTAPPMRNIERWWGREELSFLCRVKAGIDEYLPEPSGKRDLALVAFCRTLIRLSNAAFNHQSMSFKSRPAGTPVLFPVRPELPDVFDDELGHVLSSALDNPCAEAHIVAGDARNLAELTDAGFDLLITSPPYPNRISYVRELRPYMYWLGYLENGRDAGELDWQAIGGTWGIATSRLADWTGADTAYSPPDLRPVLEEISHSNNKSGRLLANYVAKYFEDMWEHLQHVRRVMAPGGRLHYIVGNSVFYGTIVRAEKFLEDMLLELGFDAVRVRTVRKRNSKKALYEFDVSAQR